MMEMTRASEMKAVEKKGLFLYLKVFGEYLDNPPRRLRTPVVGERQHPCLARQKVVAQG